MNHPRNRGQNVTKHYYPIGSMYAKAIYANIWGIFMVNVTIYSIHGSYGYWKWFIWFMAFYYHISYDLYCFFFFLNHSSYII